MCDQVEGPRSGFHAQQVDDDGHAPKCLKVFLLLLLISKLLLWLFAFDIAHSSPPMDLVKKSAATPLTICFVSQCKSEPVVHRDPRAWPVIELIVRFNFLWICSFSILRCFSFVGGGGREWHGCTSVATSSTTIVAKIC